MLVNDTVRGISAARVSRIIIHHCLLTVQKATSAAAAEGVAAINSTETKKEPSGPSLEAASAPDQICYELEPENLPIDEICAVQGDF